MTPPVVMSWCSCPHDPRYFIKRVVGIPGDEFATLIKRFSLTASA
ncbi:MAG: hypothetical protein CM15mP120_21830 [Pseudomonadota bacterium]|nr:MAG: hypothetical protein CM15mP120_21830 [Pseudomonadota bacterium]